MFHKGGAEKARVERQLRFAGLMWQLFDLVGLLASWCPEWMG
ncbi:hypothetical protein [Nitrosomonas sp. ANs5]